MLLTVASQWLTGALLTSVRLAALLLMSPLFALARPPLRIVLLLVIGFSCAINGVVRQYPQLAFERTDQLLLSAMSEAMVGAMMAFGVHCAFAAFNFAGRLLDLQVGFGVANLLDPATREQTPLFGVLLLNAGIVVFFSTGGHRWIARGFVESFNAVPLAAGLPALQPAALVAQSGLLFSLGFTLVAPIVAVLLLLDLAMAVASRSMPQMNMFMLSMPIKIGIGLMLLAALAPHFERPFGRIYQTLFHYWRQLA